MKKINWKAVLIWALPILVLFILVAVVYQTCNSSAPWFYAYWTLLGLIIVGISTSAYFSQTVRCWLGRHIVGQLLSNNNARWLLHLIVAVIITIAAMLNGFGRPLLTSSAKELKNVLVEKAGQYPNLTHEIKRSLWGTNSVPSLFAKSSAPVLEKIYPSWAWWIWAVALWLTLIIHIPFAFYDEAGQALKEAIKLVERRKHLDNIRAGGTAPTPTPTPAAESAATTAPTEKVSTWGIWKRVIQAEALTEAAEIFIKLMLKRGASLFK